MVKCSNCGAPIESGDNIIFIETFIACSDMCANDVKESLLTAPAISDDLLEVLAAPNVI